VANAQKLKSAGQQAQPLDKLYMENTLLRVAGALFCHDPKRAATHTHEIELNRGVKDKRILVRPNPRYGQPGPLAHKIFVAIIKKHSDYGRPVPSEVSFSQRELARLIGRKDFGGSDSLHIIRALTEIQTTFIETGIFNTTRNQWIEHTFNIFPEITIARRDEHSPTIEECSVLLARPIVESLKDNHFTCLNHFLMSRLGSIGQALYLRLFYHFANLYDGHHKDRLKFEKRYDDICTEWLGGLKVLPYKSVILKDQLGGHLKQLEQSGFLASWRIEKAQTREGFVISFRPGETFFADYDRFYRKRNQGELQWNFHSDRLHISEPLKVARLFQEKLAGKATDALAFVSPKDVETAKYILGRIEFADVSPFIDYALAAAKKTRFDVKSLGGIRQYLTDYVDGRTHNAAAKVAVTARAAKEREEEEVRSYERFCRSAIEELFASLPAKEKVTIEQRARAKAPRFAAKGSLANTMYEIEKIRITRERHGSKLPTLGQWKAARRTS
jgi:Replication initiator protein A